MPKAHLCQYVRACECCVSRSTVAITVKCPKEVAKPSLLHVFCCCCTSNLLAILNVKWRKLQKTIENAQRVKENANFNGTVQNVKHFQDKPTFSRHSPKRNWAIMIIISILKKGLTPKTCTFCIVLLQLLDQCSFQQFVRFSLVLEG